MEEIGEAEKDALLQMIRVMLAFRPTEMLTAAEVMKSEWMLQWALPVLDRQITE